MYGLCTDPPILCTDDQKFLWSIWIIFFYVFFYNIIKVNHFLYCFIILLLLISSFSLTRTLLVPYAYVSIESIDCILLSSFELKAILLISSVKTCFSLLNLCYVFNVDLLFFMNSLWSSLRLSTSIFYFFLNGLFYFQFELLLHRFHNLQIEIFFL